MLKIKKIKVKLGEKVIFSNIDLHIKSSEILVVTGSNGSGKTTFLRALSGLIDLDEGEILCADHNIKEYFNDYIHDYSYLSADNVFNNKFKIKYYLNFWSKFYGSEQMIESVVHYFSMNNILDFKVGQISSGWKKRLSFAKLILENKFLWFLDEPFNFLDTKGRDILTNMINSKLLSGGLVVITSNQKIDDFKNARFFDIEEKRESSVEKLQ